MTMNKIQKQSLYESIMKSVAKTVKKALNEDDRNIEDRRQEFLDLIFAAVNKNGGEAPFHFQYGNYNNPVSVPAVADENGITILENPDYLDEPDDFPEDYEEEEYPKFETYDKISTDDLWCYSSWLEGEYLEE